MGLLRMRMDALHYALLAVLVLLVFYAASTYGLVKEGETANNLVSSCSDIKDKVKCNNSTSTNAKENYGPEHDDCKWAEVTKTCHSAVETNQLESHSQQEKQNDTELCPTITCPNGKKMPCCTGHSCCGDGGWTAPQNISLAG